jgi:very-short-patch-repair endonuclease
LRRQGFNLRRQVEIGKYIADFASHRERLVIEVDGAQHYEEDNQERDQRRTDFLESARYRVLRYSNYAVLQNIDRVMQEIFDVLIERRRLKFERPAYAVPPPDPSARKRSEGSTAPRRGR